MRSISTYPEKHNHPYHLTRRDRALVGATAVGGLIAMGSVLGVNSETKATSIPDKPLTDEQVFDNQINQAIHTGPQSAEDIIGTYPVGQDRTIANAIIQEANKAGYPIDIDKVDDLLTVTLSANAFDSENGLSYQPTDTFVLFKQDVNLDNKEEILAKSVEVSK
ncbi:MAG: hypothetical protein JWO55_619 [Candidatus Saccharibacteria bacterium]|jgi:bacterioferritin-associated ferredoxin|nr:hypothetical protein [Candidatus Saccharibacteria bacterium]